jgi:AcrR family transcriptional regulator
MKRRDAISFDGISQMAVMMATGKAAARTRTAAPEETAVAAPQKARSRNAGKTQLMILDAAEAEFCMHGFDGARIDKIAKRSRSNTRMIYHYFASKENLYLNCLERIYLRVRTEESLLDLKKEAPVEGMTKLVDFTFRHLLGNPEFVRMVMNENLLHGRYLRRSKLVPALTLHLVEVIKDLLRRGARAGVFRRGVDPVQLYITILAVSNIHLSNRYTLSTMFQLDLADAGWLEERCAHARAVVLGYLRPEEPRAPASRRLDRISN